MLFRPKLTRQLDHKSEQARQHAAALLLLLKEPGCDIKWLAQNCLADVFIFACQAVVDEPHVACNLTPFFLSREDDKDMDVRTAVGAVSYDAYAPGTAQGTALFLEAQCSFFSDVRDPASRSLGNKDKDVLQVADDADARVHLFRRACIMFGGWLQSHTEDGGDSLGSYVGFEIQQPRGLKDEWLAAWQSDKAALQVCACVG